MPDTPSRDVPNAKLVKDGKLGGDVPKPAAPAAYKRKLSNYMLDKSLQLRYVLLVTILSGIIAGSLGYLINDQRHSASSKIEDDLVELTASDPSLAEFQHEIADDMSSQDRALIYKMVGIGLGLVIILSGYLVIMTHKVAGPLYKTSMYFDRMAEGRLGNVTALRRGDMLQDFFTTFRDAHDAVRARFVTDLGVMENAQQVLRAKLGDDGKAAVDAFAAHVDKRRAALHRQEWTGSLPVVSSNPKLIVAASLVWVIYGFLDIISAARSLDAGWLIVIPLVLGAGFLMSGARVLTGKQATLGGIAVAALLVAFLGAVVAMTDLQTMRHIPSWARIVIWATNAALAASGIAALIGGDKYASWAAAKSRRKA
ncbi:MAG TPA: hypothetical protein VH143_08410 [Kofleriaceae bacterium]|nr:hypothetical protein [Kofleriaceae bacterium]